MLSALQNVEVFHLCFLRALFSSASTKALFAVKGGCNLRFFFDSPRYSEDLDLDVTTVAQTTLEKNVRHLLDGQLLRTLLRNYGLTISDTSAPKQTDTTQRWKLGLKAAGLSVVLRTKIEFSRRRGVVGSTYESVRREVTDGYRMPPLLGTHYPAVVATTQKVIALAQRNVVQARDVFDLYHLFGGHVSSPLTTLSSDTVHRAIEASLSLGYDDYASQVVAYLAPDGATLHGSVRAWNTMQAYVIDRLKLLLAS